MMLHSVQKKKETRGTLAPHFQQARSPSSTGEDSGVSTAAAANVRVLRMVCSLKTAAVAEWGWAAVPRAAARLYCVPAAAAPNAAFGIDVPFAARLGANCRLHRQQELRWREGTS